MESDLETTIMYQEWRDLLFLSWKYPSNLIQKTLPPGLEVDTFQDDAYVTLVPFVIKNLSIAKFPSLPFFSDFIEVNVRTYVYDKQGRPGIWFYSLDINSIMATMAARQLFSLPYHFSHLEIDKKKEIEIKGSRSERTKMFFKYKTDGQSFKAKEGTLDFFLIERYLLFSFTRNQLFRQKIQHLSYSLSYHSLISYQETLLETNALPAHEETPHHICYSKGVNVDFFPLKKNELN